MRMLCIMIEKQETYQHEDYLWPPSRFDETSVAPWKKKKKIPADIWVDGDWKYEFFFLTTRRI